MDKVSWTPDGALEHSINDELRAVAPPGHAADYCAAAGVELPPDPPQQLGAGRDADELHGRRDKSGHSGRKPEKTD